MVPDQPSWYRTLYVNGNSNEGIFELQYDTKNKPVLWMFQSNRQFIASPIVMDEVYTIDLN